MAESNSSVELREVNAVMLCPTRVSRLSLRAALLCTVMALLLSPSVSADGGSSAIYVVKPDGTGLTRVAGGIQTASLYHPTWAPDGKRLAVAASVQLPDGTEKNGLWTLKVDGTDEAYVTEAAAADAQPDWAPSGVKLVFALVTGSLGDGPATQLAVADGQTVTQLTQEPSRRYAGPAWSPDGERIAFSVFDRADGSGIYVMSADGGEATRLTHQADHGPAWSPDASRVLFVRAAGPEPGLYVMRSDGTELVRLTGGRDDRAPDWAPDGKVIVYSHREAGGWRVYLIAADGSNPRPLFPNAEQLGTDPAWSPDGQWIAFSG